MAKVTKLKYNNIKLFLPTERTVEKYEQFCKNSRENLYWSSIASNVVKQGLPIY